MKSPLIALLLLSLAINAGLGIYSLTRPAAAVSTTASAQTKTTADATSTTATAGSSTTQSQASGSSKTSHPTGPIQWRTPTTDADLHGVVANLRSAGFPAATIRAIINQLLQERFAMRQSAADQPFWKRNNQTPEQIAAEQALRTERTALFEALLGPDALPSSVISPAQREQRFGRLSDDKFNAVMRIENDYSEIRSAAYATREKNASNRGASIAEQQRIMEQEKWADLATVLTPDELAQYELRSSPAAQRLINNLRGVDITEAEYVRLYQAQKTHDATSPSLTSMSGGTITAEMMAQRTAAQQVLNEQVRSVLNDDRFYKYLEGSDSNFGRLTQFTAQYPSITPAVSYQLYQLQNEAQSSLMAASRNRASGTAQQRTQEMQTMMAGYETRLQTLIGPEAAEAYKKSQAGRIFGSFSNAVRVQTSSGN